MLKRALAALGLTLALCGGSALAADGKVSRDRLDSIMSAWPDDVRANAEKLIAEYGMPDRVTATILVWDVPGAAQQQAMMRAAGEMVHRAEAGDENLTPQMSN